MAAEKMREIKIAIPEDLFAVLIPSKTQDHLHKARKEILLALRSLIDARLESLEKREVQKGEPKKKIKIE
jgi:hypothetical protein